MSYDDRYSFYSLYSLYGSYSPSIINKCCKSTTFNRKSIAF